MARRAAVCEGRGAGACDLDRSVRSGWGFARICEFAPAREKQSRWRGLRRSLPRPRRGSPGHLAWRARNAATPPERCTGAADETSLAPARRWRNQETKRGRRATERGRGRVQGRAGGAAASTGARARCLRAGMGRWEIGAPARSHLSCGASGSEDGETKGDHSRGQNRPGGAGRQRQRRPPALELAPRSGLERLGGVLEQGRPRRPARKRRG